MREEGWENGILNTKEESHTAICLPLKTSNSEFSRSDQPLFHRTPSPCFKHCYRSVKPQILQCSRASWNIVHTIIKPWASCTRVMSDELAAVCACVRTHIFPNLPVPISRSTLPPTSTTPLPSYALHTLPHPSHYHTWHLAYKGQMTPTHKI